MHLLPDKDPWRILLVEIDSEISDFLRKNLMAIFPGGDSNGLELLSAKNISHAIEMMMRDPFGAIIVNPDFREDKKSLQTIQKIHAADPDSAIIILSDNDDPQWAEQSIDFNIKGYLPLHALDGAMIRQTVSMALIKSRQEKRSRFAKDKYKTIIHNLPDAYFELDLAGNYVYVNKSAESHFNRTLEELSQMDFRALYPEKQYEPIIEKFIKMYTGEIGPQIYETELLGRDGSIFYVEIGAAVMKDENGNPIGFFGISRNITEKKIAQEKLKESEEKHRTILENMEDSYFEMDLDGHLTFFSDSLSTMLGYSKEELMGMQASRYIKEDNYKSKNEVFITCAKTRKPQFLQYEVVRKDGVVCYHEATIALIQDKNGKILGFRGVSRDLTAKREAKKALKQSETRYRDILSSIEDGYFEVDLKGSLKFFNDAMADILGYPKDELLHLSLNKIMDPDHSKRVFKAYHKILETEKPINDLQYAVIQKDGNRRSIESSVTMMRDPDDKIVGFRGIARDITIRKRIENELKLAKKDAEMASLAKSEFLANMSHEIRTPMNGVLGMYNLLFDTDMSEEQADYVETGKRSAEGLLSIINDILDFSKIEAGKLDIEIIDFDLRRSIDEIVTLPAVHAHTKGLEFICEIGNDVPTLIKGDPGRIRQIITNLCTNAIKFTPEGEILFKLELEKETQTHVDLRFSIKDTGIGISAKDQKRLFSSFEQVDASTTRKYGGTGLGLAISKNLVELMGGKIGLKSTPGKGSQFFFSLAFEKQENVEERSFDDIETIQNKRILIVDDNQTNLNILSRYLSYWGCTSDVASGGEMALSLMRAVAKAGAPYDIVISDMLMPKMDGAQLGGIIKADPDLKSTRMIMLTSQGLRGDAARMKAIGFSGYLNKPIRRSLLYDCLVMVLNQGHGESQTVTREKQLVTSYGISEGKKKKLRILLAEDNKVNQKVALALLKKFGFSADPVDNGQLAVEALEKTDYQIVLMDVQMPQMDGLTATKIIRNAESKVKNHDVLIIAMTAHAMKQDRDMCLKAGMNDYISKPIKPKTLLAIIEKNIQQISFK